MLLEVAGCFEGVVVAVAVLIGAAVVLVVVVGVVAVGVVAYHFRQHGRMFQMCLLHIVEPVEVEADHHHLHRRGV